jgi:hypothetical protein
MEQIAVTAGFVKKLASNIRQRYGRDVRHTEVLELVADAFGHKAGPLMHALKKNVVAEVFPRNVQGENSIEGLVLLPVSLRLGAEQRKWVALARVGRKKSGALALVVRDDGLNHPEASAAKHFLQRNGQAWDEVISVGAAELASLYATRQRASGAASTSIATFTLLRELRLGRDYQAPALLVTPETPLSRFALAYAERLQAGKNTRKAIALLLDAMEEEPFVVELASYSAVGLWDSGRFEVVKGLFADVDGGADSLEPITALFPSDMLAWAAGLAVAHGYLRLALGRAILCKPAVKPRLYHYDLEELKRMTVYRTNAEGKIHGGRHEFLEELCRRAAEEAVAGIGPDWRPRSATHEETTRAVSTIIRDFARSVVMDGEWTSRQLDRDVRSRYSKHVQALYEKPY